MAKKKDIPSGVVSLERLEYPARKSRRWLVFNRAPLARKIILFNLIALAILVSGVLYLNQSQDSQVASRRDGLARQGEMLSAAIRSHVGDPAFEDLTSPEFAMFFNAMVANSDSIIRIYGPDATVLLSRTPRLVQGHDADQQASVFPEYLQKLWAAVVSVVRQGGEGEIRASLDSHLADLAHQAIAANSRTKNITLSVNGEIFIATALPIEGENGAKGAIVLSTREGEVDSIIRTAREQILQTFLLATVSSIALSMVLANSIARPLRRLSAAAQNARDEAGNKLNLARVNIPDLSARPDEIGDLSRSMRNMTDALLERIDENKSFAADVAHEIKNPLTSLRSAVETLSYVEDEESRKALQEVIRNDVDRLDRLVTDISNASRLEGELVRDTWEPVDLCALLAGMLQSFDARGGYPEVEFIYECEVENSTIRGLSGRLEQVFTNLITNALSFVPAEDGWVKVSIKAAGEEALLVEVSDNGPGIPEENLTDIFSRFYSERPEEQFGEHSGLGLAISKQIVEAHGGEITASNTESHGALFKVKLPR